MLSCAQRFCQAGVADRGEVRSVRRWICCPSGEREPFDLVFIDATSELSDYLTGQYA